MGSQWVQNLVTMADAIVLTADETHRQGSACRFCGAAGAARETLHTSECPVTVASTVLKHARAAAGRSGH